MRTMSMFDGNALAGVLSSLLGADPTMLQVECGGCDATAVLADAVVERDAVASIVRCRSCTHTLFTVLEREGGVALVVESVRSLRSSV